MASSVARVECGNQGKPKAQPVLPSYSIVYTDSLSMKSLGNGAGLRLPSFAAPLRRLKVEPYDVSPASTVVSPVSPSLFSFTEAASSCDGLSPSSSPSKVSSSEEAAVDESVPQVQDGPQGTDMTTCRDESGNEVDEDEDDVPSASVKQTKAYLRRQRRRRQRMFAAERFKAPAGHGCEANHIAVASAIVTITDLGLDRICTNHGPADGKLRRRLRPASDGSSAAHR